MPKSSTLESKVCLLWGMLAGIGTWVTLVSFLPIPAPVHPLLRTDSLAHLHHRPPPSPTEELTWNAGVGVTVKEIKAYKFLKDQLSSWLFWTSGHTVVWCGLFLLHHSFEYIFYSCQAFRSKKFLASRIGLAWHTSLTNACNYTWQKYLVFSSKDLFIQIQTVTVFSSI